eukprot:403371963
MINDFDFVDSFSKKITLILCEFKENERIYRTEEMEIQEFIELEIGNVVYYRSQRSPQVEYIATIEKIYKLSYLINIYITQEDRKNNVVLRREIVFKCSPLLDFDIYNNPTCYNWINSLKVGDELIVKTEQKWVFSYIGQIRNPKQQNFPVLKANQQSQVFVKPRNQQNENSVYRDKYELWIRRNTDGKWIKLQYLQAKPILSSEIKQGNLEFVKYLIEECGQNVNSKRHYQKTPLLIACEENKLEVIELLLQHNVTLIPLVDLVKTQVLDLTKDH